MGSRPGAPEEADRRQAARVVPGCRLPDKAAFFRDPASILARPIRALMQKVILLLLGSNIFMTIAWYGHLKLRWLDGKPLIVAILVAWGVAFFEYCLQVPANRLGYTGAHMSGYQLKVIQEVITLMVFIVFAWVVLKERLTWNYAVSFAFMMLAVYFATAFKQSP
jgi:uncharacterized protein (DUF486 family)